MQKNIEELKKLFKQIKNVPLTKSLRGGYTGIGYTFESLIGKKEDRSSMPDFNGIEIKTKLGYTSTPLTLFCLSPRKDDENAIKYLYDNFGYPNKHDKRFKSFKANVYCKSNYVVATKYILKVKLDFNNNRMKLLVFDTQFNIICENIYWDLNELRNRLISKLSYLAVIKGYPYKRNNQTYYKYTSMNIYKLKGFDYFLKLITKDKIYITFNTDIYLDEIKYGKMKDRGTGFNLCLDSIDELFERIE